MARTSKLASLVALLRVHHWVKNLLVFVPLITGHEINNPHLFGLGAIAFLVFSLAASASYIINDLHDLKTDRQHPVKRWRPFASGKIAISTGYILSPLLLLVSVAIAWWTLPRLFVVTLLIYVAASAVYSLYPGFPFWPSWSVYDSRLPAAMQRFSHCCQVRYSFRCRSGLRMLADHGVPAKPEGPLATPLPRRPSATRVRWLFRAVDVTLRAQVAPKFAAACRRTTSGSDAPPQAATNNIARASRAVRPSSSADAASSSATSF